MSISSIKAICNYALVVGIPLALAGCQHFSEMETDPSAGLNGGFEIAKNDLPVNWLMYTPETVPEADFKIVLDRTNYKEGSQSLRFDVKTCSSNGGWHSPGFSSEFFLAGKYEGPAQYKLSFWLMNDGSKFNISAGGVHQKRGDMQTLIEQEENIEEWKSFEYDIDVPEKRWLRIQLNILNRGTFWIDDIRIEKI